MIQKYPESIQRFQSGTVPEKEIRQIQWMDGYTLSKTEDKFAAINNGNYFAAPQDRRNDLSVVEIYQLTKRWSLSGTFVYSTGQAVTYPPGKYEVGGLTTFSYSARDASRERLSPSR